MEEGFISLAQAEGQVLTVDLEQFEAAAARAKGSREPQSYQDALALYTGDLLPDDLYEEWTISQRETLRLVFLQLLLDLARLHETRQEFAEGIAALQQVLSVEKSHEKAHAGLMRLYALSGQRHLAVRQYQALRDVLLQELEAKPSQSTAQLHEAIQKGDFSPTQSKAHPPHNLPVQVTSFIGREKEIKSLKQIILSGQTRLVTVTGAGGIGKTRLALRAAGELLDAFPQGLWFVELAAVATPTWCRVRLHPPWACARIRSKSFSRWWWNFFTRNGLCSSSIPANTRWTQSPTLWTRSYMHHQRLSSWPPAARSWGSMVKCPSSALTWRCPHPTC